LPPPQQTALRDLFNSKQEKTFVVMVCNKVGICAIPYGEYRNALGEDFTKQRSIFVKRNPNGGFKVGGSGGDIRRVIPLSDFPDCLFQ